MSAVAPLSKLISCSACSHSIAFNAETCPSCGAQNTFVHPGVQAFLSAADRLPMRFQYRYTGLRIVGETADPQSKILAVGGVVTAMMALSIAAVFVLGASTTFLFGSVVAMALLVAVAPFVKSRGKRFTADFSSGELAWWSDDDKFWLPVWRVLSDAPRVGP
ncbi:MAG TPA: hypothetical protein PLL76_21590 [Thermoanaerobaculia bacterium]|nr:hypothetical protein [Thermoanaerobaculia bacterium]